MSRGTHVGWENFKEAKKRRPLKCGRRKNKLTACLNERAALMQDKEREEIRALESN